MKSLKIKKLKVSGLRGIIDPKELDFSDGKSMVIYAPNSYGKSSFVDALEWYLSENDVIAWLQREGAGESAYPHLKAIPGNSYVEAEFTGDPGGLNNKVLKKEMDVTRLTIAKKSSDDDFDNLYKSFAVKPYLRFLDVIKFVFLPGKDKYDQLASWMGFEEELLAQERVSLGILSILKKKLKILTSTREGYLETIKKKVETNDANELDVLKACNTIFTKYKLKETGNLKEAIERHRELKELQKQDDPSKKQALLSQLDSKISGFLLKKDIGNKISETNRLMQEIESKGAINMDSIEIYTKGRDQIAQLADDTIDCPLCGTPWSKEELVAHIKKELENLGELKTLKGNLKNKLEELLQLVQCELFKLKESREAKGELIKLGFIEENEESAISKYIEILEKLEEDIKDQQNKLTQLLEIKTDIIDNVRIEFVALSEKIKNKLATSRKDGGASLAIDMVLVGDILDFKSAINEIDEKYRFFSGQLDEFSKYAKKLSDLITADTKDRFDKISKEIQKNFDILRKDKSISNIELILKTSGRSAEVKVDYYDEEITPTYKVLSESLLNSMGLAIFLACVKQFNPEFKLIVLDDIINSLDAENREGMLELLNRDFSDYQILILTHDRNWLRRLQNEFPLWIFKKIMRWGYDTGPIMDFVPTTQKEVEELLEDSTKTDIAGATLGRHIEERMSILCEDMRAKLEFRYRAREPVMLGELFDGLVLRLEEKSPSSDALAKLKAVSSVAILRNFSSHAYMPGSIEYTPEEVLETSKKWFAFEAAIKCADCNKFVKYNIDKRIIKCMCGNLKIK